MKEKLMEIGRDTASLWGAECISYKIDKKNKEVIFNCIEYGERFSTTLSFEELEEKYNLNVEDKTIDSSGSKKTIEKIKI